MPFLMNLNAAIVPLIGAVVLLLTGCTPWFDGDADPTPTPLVEQTRLIGSVFQELQARRACEDLLRGLFDCMNAYIRFSGGDDPVAICVHTDGTRFTVPDAAPGWVIGSDCNTDGIVTAIVGGS